MTEPPEPQPVAWQQQPGPSNWGSTASPGPIGPGTPTRRAGTVAVVFGALALLSSPVLGGLLLGVPALILGIRARRRAARNGSVPDGRATAGMVLGGIALAVSSAFVVYVLTGSAFRDYLDCVRAAGESSTAAEACEDSLRDQISGG